MADVVRVHVHNGLNREYAATNFSLSPHGLTITRPRSDGQPGEEIVAVLRPRQVRLGGACPEGTPLAEELTPFDASELGRASRNKP